MEGPVIFLASAIVGMWMIIEYLLGKLFEYLIPSDIFWSVFIIGGLQVLISLSAAEMFMVLDFKGYLFWYLFAFFLIFALLLLKMRTESKMNELNESWGQGNT